MESFLQSLNGFFAQSDAGAFSPFLSYLVYVTRFMLPIAAILILMRCAYSIERDTILCTIASSTCKPKARIIGDVSYASIEIHQGAVIEGRLIHTKPQAEPNSATTDQD